MRNEVGEDGVIYRPSSAVLPGDLCDFSCPRGSAARGGRLLCHSGVLAGGSKCEAIVVGSAVVDDAAALGAADAAAAALRDPCAPFGGAGFVASATDAKLGAPSKSMPFVGVALQVPKLHLA